MKYSLNMNFEKDFVDFINCSENRSGFIVDWLSSHGVNASIAPIDGKQHVLVQFGSSAYNSSFKIKTVICHHDRVENSPGANDNSAACWQIMNWAVWLSQLKTFHNIRIFFTDGEELGWDTGVSQQGAFGIASTFRRLGIMDDEIYVFDACGRGDIPILSKSSITESAPQKFKKQFSDLFESTQNLLTASCPGRWMALPVSYSDNASFLACGIPAVAITLLPADEASLYARNLNQNKSLEEAVLNRESSHVQRMQENIPDYSYKDHLPLTWRLFHTEKDNLESLTESSFSVMEKILKNLAALKTLK